MCTPCTTPSTTSCATAGHGQWVEANLKEAAERLSPIWGNVPAATVEQVNTRRSYAIVPVQREALAESQRIADTFRKAGLILRDLTATATAI